MAQATPAKHSKGILTMPLEEQELMCPRLEEECANRHRLLPLRRSSKCVRDWSERLRTPPLTPPPPPQRHRKHQATRLHGTRLPRRHNGTTAPGGEAAHGYYDDAARTSPLRLGRATASSPSPFLFSPPFFLRSYLQPPNCSLFAWSGQASTPTPLSRL